MKAKEFCSLNKCDDGQLYVVDSIVGLTANLLYCAGDEQCKSQIDKSLLLKPTKAQLNHSYNAATVSKFQHQTMYPLKIKSSADFINELAGCETGRYEDACIARDENDVESIKDNDYDCVLCDFITRHKTLIEVRNDTELCELYYALASGTIGILRGSTAKLMRDKIRDKVKEIDPALVGMYR